MIHRERDDYGDPVGPWVLVLSPGPAFEEVVGSIRWRTRQVRTWWGKAWAPIDLSGPWTEAWPGWWYWALRQVTSGGASPSIGALLARSHPLGSP